MKLKRREEEEGKRDHKVGKWDTYIYIGVKTGYSVDISHHYVLCDQVDMFYVFCHTHRKRMG